MQNSVRVRLVPSIFFADKENFHSSLLYLTHYQKKKIPLGLNMLFAKKFFL